MWRMVQESQNVYSVEYHISTVHIRDMWSGGSLDIWLTILKNHYLKHENTSEGRGLNQP
jgi:hypothetical protein